MQATGLMLAVAAAALAAAAPPGKPGRELQSGTPPSGASIYKAYCASCHGQEGTGGGPAAEALRMRPADLTKLKQRSKGEFPVYRLKKMLDGSEELRAHGSKRMSVWGPGLGPERAKALIEQLESMQK